MMPKKHIRIAVAYFLIIAFLGALLRFFFVIDIPLNYKHLVHTHSHIALLGWLYTALTTLIYFCYLHKKSLEKKYKLLFWSGQITIIGMLISFPITGYALFSIIFSSLFLLVSYWFLWFFKKHTTKDQKQLNSYKLVHAGLWFMVLSSIGPWALGAIMNTLGNASIWYKNAIYFYLHFQYNGWFIVSLFGILFFVLEKQNIAISNTHFKRFYMLLISSAVLTLFVSVLWFKPPFIFNILAGLGSALQFVAFGVLLKIIRPHLSNLKSKTPSIVLVIFKMVTILFLLKMVMQLLGSTSYFSEIISNHVDFAVGYIHWVFLGVISLSLFGFLNHFKLMILSKRTVQLFIVGFLLTEILLFYKGIVNWLNVELLESYYVILAIASAILFLAVAFVCKLQFKK